MSENKKEFGVWMDSHHATVVGRKDVDKGEFVVLGHTLNDDFEKSDSEKREHNAERGLLHKFFKEITVHMQNATDVYVTGTGIAQEQFIHYLAETQQFKNVNAKAGTSNKMSDEKLIEHISDKFNVAILF